MLWLTRESTAGMRVFISGSAPLLAETHRIEVAAGRPEPAPDKQAVPDRLASAIDTVATRTSTARGGVRADPSPLLVSQSGFAGSGKPA